MMNIVNYRTLKYGARTVSDKYIHFSLIYMIDHIFPVLPIKISVNQDGESTMPQKLTTGMKISVSKRIVLFFPCVVRKETAHVETKLLNMRHQSQKRFCGIFVGTPHYQKGTSYTFLVHGK